MTYFKLFLATFPRSVTLRNEEDCVVRSSQGKPKDRGVCVQIRDMWKFSLINVAPLVPLKVTDFFDLSFLYFVCLILENPWEV